MAPSKRVVLRVDGSKAVAALKKLIATGDDFGRRQVRGQPSLNGLIDEMSAWDVHIQKVLGELFAGSRILNEYNAIGPDREGKYNDWQALHAHILDDLSERLTVLASIRDRVKLFDSGGAEPTGRTRGKGTGKKRVQVFLVIGRDDAWNAVARVLEKLKLDVIVLEERPSRSRTIIEKLERESAGSAYAVVMLSPDDEGRLRGSGGELAPRARQNVIFELGYFIGKLGRGFVTAMLPAGMERPSDIDGVMYVAMSDRGWKLELGKEIRAAFPSRVSLDDL